MIDDPHLAVATRGNRDRFQTDRNGSRVLEPLRDDGENLEAIIGRVDSE